jgi:L-ascorbate metabolism protein UlaG (beta-lactamase superfamily)
MAEPLVWLGHASFLVTAARKTIYLDPWDLTGSPLLADLVLVTHDHYDHFSEKDIRRLLKPETVVVTVADCARKLKGNVITLKPGDKTDVGGVKVQAVRAYNVTKPFHPKSRDWVGFIVDVGGMKVYHAGDTDHIPEMKDVRTDVALLPVGGTYTMNAEEAAQAVKDIRPEAAVPMHYGAIVGTADDARRFAALAKGSTTVQVLQARR